jgi:hypothetical protein
MKLTSDDPLAGEVAGNVVGTAEEADRMMSILRAAGDAVEQQHRQRDG